MSEFYFLHRTNSLQTAMRLKNILIEHGIPATVQEFNEDQIKYFYVKVIKKDRRESQIILKKFIRGDVY
ncbi:MAG: hypothetical protein APR63_04690 [Desulfuromonas sp. SDB]|nr:MAG: hypothetical protein APR63_04690 [Desulfuromonas sp. SDB]